MYKGENRSFVRNYMLGREGLRKQFKKSLRIGDTYQDGRVGGHGTQPLHPNKTSKIQLHVEQFSLKTNWKLAERLLYSQDCKKDPHILG